MEDVLVDGVEGAAIGVPVLVQPNDDLVRRCRQLRLHQIRQRSLWPVRIGFAQEVGNLYRILLPAVVAPLLCRLIARRRGFDQVDRNRDVVLQERRQC